MRKVRFLLSLVLCLAVAVSFAQEPKKKRGGKGRKGGGAPAQVQEDQAEGKGKSQPKPYKLVNDDLAGEATLFYGGVRKKMADTVYDKLSEEVKKAITPEQLNQVWDTAIAQMGEFKRLGPVRAHKVGAIDVRIIPTNFEKASVDAWFSFNASKQITGFRFFPTDSDLPPEPAKKDEAASGQDQEATVGAGTPWSLPGTLTMPKGAGPFPAVILVHGSGPQDRDETIGANKPFRDLAEGLSAKGVAVLRYEKRTKQHALEMAGLTTPITVKEETIDDVIEAVKLLQGNKKIDGKRIVVLGHSLGGMLIPRIAQAGGNIAGFIVMAGNVRPMEDLILAQTNYLATLNGKPSPDEQKKIADAQALVDQIKGLKPGVKSSLFIMGASPEYWLDLRGYDPALAAKAITKPLLVLQGERDYQVTVEDFKRWQAALNGQPNFTAKLYPGLNHLFILGQGKSIPSEYNVPGRMAQTVIDDIAAWVKQLK